MEPRGQDGPEGWLRTIAARAHCILWHAEVSEREDGSLEWHLRVIDEEAAQRFFPVYIPPGMSYEDAWYTSRLPEDIVRMRYGDEQVRAGRSYKQEFRCRRIDGEVRWFAEDVQVEPLALGRWHVVGVCLDITERKEAELAVRVSEEEQRRFAEQLTTLHEVSNQLSKAASLDDLCLNAVELGRSRLGFDRLGIWFLDEGRGAATGSFGIDEQGNIRDERQSRVVITRPSLAGQVLAGRKRLLHWRDASVRDDRGEVVGYAEQAVAGLWDGEEVIGFISIDNFLRRRPITERACELLTVYASVLGHLSSLKRAEEAVQASERRFRALIEGSWDGIALVDTQGVLSYTSPSMTRILGWTAEEIHGQSFLERIHPADASRCRELLGQILDRPGASVSTACRYLHRRGNWVWIEGTGTNLTEEPGVAAIVLNFRDVTERRHMEEELQARARALTEADRAKDRFLAMLAHELRNPLAPILHAVQLLKRPEPNASQRRHAVDVIERQASQQARLLDDLLHVSRIARGSIALHPVCLDLVKLVRDTVEDHRPSLEDAGLELFQELPSEPVWVEGDPTRLAQILGNLLQNAQKFTDPGGRVTVRLTAADATDPRAAVTVCDTGIGIEPEMLDRVFDTFTQADGSLERRHGGLGLGLALVRGLVALHGGEVRAESAGPGQGAAFTAWLPLVDRPMLNAAPGAWMTTSRERVVSIPDPEAAPSPRRILVIEDNRDTAESLRELLSVAGHEVRVAYSGPSGVAAAADYQPEIVLCDVGLPGLDGYAVARRLRQAPATVNARLIAITGYGQAEDRRHAAEAGFDEHLTKPVDITELERLLAEPLVTAP
jgi:PAS domain S-box-containing protein